MDCRLACQRILQLAFATDCWTSAAAYVTVIFRPMADAASRMDQADCKNAEVSAVRMFFQYAICEFRIDVEAPFR